MTGADVRTGGDATLQLQLQTAGAGAFDPATYGGDAAVASAVRQAFLLTVPRDALVSTVVAPLWPEAVVAAALLPTVGPDAGGDVAPSGPADIAGARRLLEEAGVTEPVTVRVLVNSTDPQRAAMLALVTESASEVGFEVEPYAPTRSGRTWWGRRTPGTRRSCRCRSRTCPWTRCCRGGGPAARRTSPAGRTRARTRPRRRSRRPSTLTTVEDQLAAVAESLDAGGAVLSLVRQPVVVATRGSAAPTAGTTPAAPDVEPLALGRADLTSWWAWARTE